MILQMVVVFMLIVIGAMIYRNTKPANEQIESDIQNLDLTCPEPSCPEPSVPSIPQFTKSYHV